MEKEKRIVFYNMETEQKRKKKKAETFLLIGYDNINKEDAIRTMKDMKLHLVKIFRFHIGEENSISPYDLFYEIFRFNPINLDIYKREYLWNLIKIMIRQLRKEGTCFIINSRSKLYVLKTKKEFKSFANLIDRDVANLKASKERAREWVEKSLWKQLSIGEDNQDNSEGEQ
jgi:hypothetical protein